MSDRAEMLANLRGALSNGGHVVMLTRYTAERIARALEANGALLAACEQALSDYDEMSCESTYENSFYDRATGECMCWVCGSGRVLRAAIAKAREVAP